SGAPTQGTPRASARIRASMALEEGSMLRIDTHRPRAIEVFSRTTHSTLSALSLAPGESAGNPAERLDTADQWMIVIAGKGEAIVAGESFPLRKGVVLLIERGEPHQIRAAVDTPLRALRVDARRTR
ncbi:MAG: cupin domain-containing protein, partial [Thermoanaerobaculia bacterium]